jgi:hypothetical protein
MSFQVETDAERKGMRAHVGVAIATAILLATLAIIFVAGAFWFRGITSPPSAKLQYEEAASLQTHVLPVVKDLRATWYLNEGTGSGSIYWKRGNFTDDPSRARSDGDALFDNETKEVFDRFDLAIRASGVPTNRLCDAQFADDGSLRSASFKRRGGGLKFVFTYIYSPGIKPAEWKSDLGPVVLTRIGNSDWWFEQSPDD